MTTFHNGTLCPNNDGTSRVGELQNTFKQNMFFNKTKNHGKLEHGKSLTISSPTQNGLGALEVVMHAHSEGWWHPGVYPGILKVIIHMASPERIAEYEHFQNNRLMKLGNVCHISTLPKDVFPADLALGIQLNAKGNNVTTEDDELDIHTVLLDDYDGELTGDEEKELHPDITNRCSGSAYKKFIEAPINKSQSDALNNGEVIFLDSQSPRAQCYVLVSYFSFL